VPCSLSRVFAPVSRRTPARRHCAAERYKVPFPTAQHLSAEVPASGGSFFIDSAAPFPDSAAVRLFSVEVPARRIGKKISTLLLQSTLTEVLELVGFALPYKGDREPPAALATAAAGAVCGGLQGGFHTYHLDQTWRKDNGSTGLCPDQNPEKLGAGFTGVQCPGTGWHGGTAGGSCSEGPEIPEQVA
jgi:hypothetical protein